MVNTNHSPFFLMKLQQRFWYSRRLRQVRILKAAGPDTEDRCLFRQYSTVGKAGGMDKLTIYF